MTLFVRKNIWSLGQNDPTILWYALAVNEMQQRSPNDVASWSYQAAIHGTFAAQQPLFNQCRHGSWFFLPWHRAYLYYFERIVRNTIVALEGPADWALPFWDYDAGGQANSLPHAFRSSTLQGLPAGMKNPLFVSGRTLTGNAGLPTSVTSPAAAMARTSFSGATQFGGDAIQPPPNNWAQAGLLEQTPHNDIHVQIGGIMGHPATAAADPIFWLHHCNIDRLWWVWQKSNANPTVAAWANLKFRFFDHTGTQASLAGKDLLITETQLDYTYTPPAPVAVVPPPPPPSNEWPAPWPKAPARGAPPGRGLEGVEANMRELIGATAQGIQLTGESVSVPVPINRPALESMAAQPSLERRAFVDIEGVDAERNPGTVYGVYVNLPAQPTREQLGERHVGNVSLFGIEFMRSPQRDEPAHTMRFSMEITNVLNRLAAKGEWQNGQRIDVTFRQLTLEGPRTGLESMAESLPAAQHQDTPIRIGRISIHSQ